MCLLAVDDTIDFDCARCQRLTDEQVVAAQQAVGIDYLVDQCCSGQPLIVSFSYFTQTEFDMFGRIRKLESQLGMPLNRIMLRDSRNAWYQYGVAGLGDSVDAVAARLRQMIAAIKPSKVICIGQSMGGYAAILFGMLLQADAVIAYGPLSYLKAEWVERDGDQRWLPVFRALSRQLPMPFYDDLINLAKSYSTLPQLHIVAGTNPDGTGGMPNMDQIHVDRYAGLPGVRLHIYPEARHEVSYWLVDKGLMDQLLYSIVEPLLAGEGGQVLPIPGSANASIFSVG